MKWFALLAPLITLGTTAHAAFTVSIEPANPTPADDIVVTIRDTAPRCIYIIPSATRFEPPNMIRLEHALPEACDFAPVPEAKVTIGRFPAGTYRVGLGGDSSTFSPPPGPEVIVEFTVSQGTSPNSQLPRENYGGQYLTGAVFNGTFFQQYGEGVFIEQFGQTSFLTLATYDSAGRPTWYVMTDGRWRFNASRSRYEFAGSVYQATRTDGSPPAILVNPVGTVAWYPVGFDTLTLEGTINGSPTHRTLRRFRF